MIDDGEELPGILSHQVVKLSGLTDLGELRLHEFQRSCLLLLVLQVEDPRSQPGLDVGVNLLGEQRHGDGEVRQIPEVAFQSLQGFLSDHFINISELPELLVKSEIVHGRIRSNG